MHEQSIYILILGGSNIIKFELIFNDFQIIFYNEGEKSYGQRFKESAKSFISIGGLINTISA